MLKRRERKLLRKEIVMMWKMECDEGSMGGGCEACNVEKKVTLRLLRMGY